VKKFLNYIKHQLRESIGFYDLSFHRFNLSSEQEILAAINRLNAEYLSTDNSLWQRSPTN
jgi:hypothetical protein